MKILLRGEFEMREMALRMPSNYSDVNSDEMEYIDGGGFVGFHVYMADWVVNAGKIAGAAFVAGFVGWYAKSLAKNPWGAGAAALITATAAGVAGWAISQGLRDFYIGANVPFVSWSQNLYAGY